MADKWSDIINDQRFGQLSNEDKQRVRDEYFKNVLEPVALSRKADVNEVRSIFNEHYNYLPTTEQPVQEEKEKEEVVPQDYSWNLEDVPVEPYKFPEQHPTGTSISDIAARQGKSVGEMVNETSKPIKESATNISEFQKKNIEATGSIYDTGEAAKLREDLVYKTAEGFIDRGDATTVEEALELAEKKVLRDDIYTAINVITLPLGWPKTLMAKAASDIATRVATFGGLEASKEYLSNIVSDVLADADIDTDTATKNAIIAGLLGGTAGLLGGKNVAKAGDLAKDIYIAKEELGWAIERTYGYEAPIKNVLKNGLDKSKLSDLAGVNFIFKGRDSTADLFKNTSLRIYDDFSNIFSKAGSLNESQVSRLVNAYGDTDAFKLTVKEVLEEAGLITRQLSDEASTLTQRGMVDSGVEFFSNVVKHKRMPTPLSTTARKTLDDEAAILSKDETVINSLKHDLSNIREGAVQQLGGADANLNLILQQELAKKSNKGLWESIKGIPEGFLIETGVSSVGRSRTQQLANLIEFGLIDKGQKFAIERATKKITDETLSMLKSAKSSKIFAGDLGRSVGKETTPEYVKALDKVIDKVKEGNISKITISEFAEVNSRLKPEQRVQLQNFIAMTQVNAAKQAPKNSLLGRLFSDNLTLTSSAGYFLGAELTSASTMAALMLSITGGQALFKSVSAKNYRALMRKATQMETAFKKEINKLRKEGIEPNKEVIEEAMVEAFKKETGKTIDNQARSMALAIAAAQTSKTAMFKSENLFNDEE